MQAFFIIIGFMACFAAVAIGFIKAIDTYFFLKDFHEKVTKSLATIEDKLSKLKP